MTAIVYGSFEHRPGEPRRKTEGLRGRAGDSVEPLACLRKLFAGTGEQAQVPE